MNWRPLLDFIFPPQCASCNALGAGLCASCTPDGEPICIRLPTLSVTAFGPYESTLRSALLALKDGRRDVAESLARSMASLVAPGSILVPIPTTAERRRVRGVDGVALMAQHAAKITGAGVLLALEQRSGDAQRGRSRVERLAARGRFSCRPSVAGRHITLFDDVCTTGATLRDSAAAVREAGGVVEKAVVVAAPKSERAWSIPLNETA